MCSLGELQGGCKCGRKCNVSEPQERRLDADHPRWGIPYTEVLEGQGVVVCEERRGGLAQPYLTQIDYVGTWGGSSAGRAPRSHRGGQGFDPPPLHHRIAKGCGQPQPFFLFSEEAFPPRPGRLAQQVIIHRERSSGLHPLP
jgi:hypothetical protein